MSDNYEEIEIQIEDDILLKLALEAHHKDMKLNDYLIEIVMEYVEKQNNELETKIKR